MTATDRRIGRQRAVRERAVIVDAVSTLTHQLATYNVDREYHDRQAIRKLNGLPKRYREEFYGMADALPVPVADLRLYMFALGDITNAISDVDPEPEGCTNVIVAGEHTTHGDSLLLKNRDVSGAGLRPQVAVTYPDVGARHGFVTISTCGSVLVYQGVNDAGLAAANTFVDVETDTATEDKLLNGVLVRQLLEECSTVADARAFVAKQPLDRIQGLTLALADQTDTAMLEIDPLVPEIRLVSGTIGVRTNHFVQDETELNETASTAVRFTRAHDLVDGFSETLDRAALFGMADDHRDGPGSDSICRHGDNDTDPYRLDQSTTVSATVYRGGIPACYGIVGTPCQSSPVKLAVDQPIPTSLQTGQYWRETVENSR